MQLVWIKSCVSSAYECRVIPCRWVILMSPTMHNKITPVYLCCLAVHHKQQFVDCFLLKLAVWVCCLLKCEINTWVLDVTSVNHYLVTLQTHLASIVICFQLDYCNSPVMGMSNQNLIKLQWRIVTKDHVDLFRMCAVRMSEISRIRNNNFKVSLVMVLFTMVKNNE